MHKIILFLILMQLHLKSQNVEGRVRDSSGTDIPFLAVGLLNATDSSIIRGTLTDDKENLFSRR